MHILSVVCLGVERAPVGDKCVPHVKCAAGEFTAIPGNSSSQPTCEPCPPGYYKAAMSTTSTETDECDAVEVSASVFFVVAVIGVVSVAVVGVAAFIWCWCVQSIHY